MSNRPNEKPLQRHVAQAHKAESSNRIWWIIGIVVVVIAAAMGIAIVRGQESGGQPGAGFNTSTDAPADLVDATVEVRGEPLPKMPESSAAPDPADGKTAPTLVGNKFNGEPITIGGSGRPMVVTFVAHWCPHCQKEVPQIAAHLNGTLPSDVDLYAVSTSVDKTAANYPPGAWLRKENWPVPTLVDDANGTAARAYGLSGFPYFVVVDASGKVVDRASGEISMQQFDALLNAARSGNPA